MDQSLPFNPSFKQVANEVYKTATESLDFQNKVLEAASLVNQWANQKTNGLIKEILSPGAVDNKTRLIFANALYFKGAWHEKFDASETGCYEFHLLNGGCVLASFMTTTTKQFVKEFDDFKVLRLPYNQGNADKRHFSMYLFLPNANDGLPDLIEKINSKSRFVQRHLPSKKVVVGEFLIPKFRTTFGFEASKILKELGLKLPFSEGADLGDVVAPGHEAKNLLVSNIFHKSFIEVNEEGTEAAAVTASITMKCDMPVEEDRIDFVADHPFLFFVMEDTTATVLFIGTLLNPLIN